MIKFKDFMGDSMNEASFSAGKIEKVAELVAKIMGKEFKGKFFSLGIENFKSKLHGVGKGIRYMNNAGEQVRFNWTAKEGSKSKYIITSCDYWDANNIKINKPSYSIKIGSEVNIVEVVGIIISAFKKGKIGVLQSSVNEARSSGERKEWLKSKGLPTSYGDSEGNTRRRAKKAGLESELEAFLGGEEINDLETELVQAEETLEKTPYADPDVVFKDIEDLTRATIAGVTTSLIIAGDPGTGKCVGANTELNIKGL